MLFCNFPSINNFTYRRWRRYFCIVAVSIPRFRWRWRGRTGRRLAVGQIVVLGCCLELRRGRALLGDCSWGWRSSHLNDAIRLITIGFIVPQLLLALSFLCRGKLRILVCYGWLGQWSCRVKIRPNCSLM